MLLACALFFSCDKEEDAVINVPQNLQNTTFSKSGDAVQVLLKEAYNTFFEMEESYYIELTATLENDLIENAALSNTESIPLEHIFYVYEGAVNSMYANQGGEDTIMTGAQSENFDDGIKSDDFNFEVEITLNEEEKHSINAEVFNAFHATVNNTINNFIEESEVQNLLVSDFDLKFISSTSAVISLSLVSGRKAIPKPQFPIPFGEIYAFDALGMCSNSIPNTVDAADFFRGYANSYKTKPSQCANAGYSIFLGVFNTQSPKANNTLNRCMENYVWDNHAHPDCIGDDTNQVNNNQIWHSWYSVMDQLVDNPLNYFQQQYPIFNPAKRQVRFYITDYQDFNSIPGTPSGICYKPGYTKYHGGKFYYEVEVCP